MLLETRLKIITLYPCLPGVSNQGCLLTERLFRPDIAFKVGTNITAEADIHIPNHTLGTGVILTTPANS